ncbi:MAG: short-chain dehydrogenase [Thermobacillus sp. ZCTH02-B1]|uniref:SDR family oxidoreductase n=1 Tax=Thermobacillus sp. ZCTH02-B1 TaxID=1858795 RepID=UPI000B57D9E7|nr:SDR family oxidoreductase [Thermobacillus sp. ZCTH02-B1]OUM95641.1 MAG: short-chain dehydrogenase [Thermobacillus sp. ZCTH02-B1]
MKPFAGKLEGKVALVAGGTRGAGRGIAIELGAVGATVYVTGRTTRKQRSEYNRPETIEETAELVTEAGGQGIAVQVDHLVPEQVKALVQRIEREQGRLDILVNDIWGAEYMTEWNVPIWQHSLEKGLRMLDLGVRTHLITSHFALPLLIRRPGGLVVEVTDGTEEFNRSEYRLNVFYDLAKISLNRVAWALAQELKPHGCTAVSLTPGWMRSEIMLEHFGVTEDDWRKAAEKEPHFLISETPRYVGRAVAALASDPDVSRWNGRSLSSGELAEVYGFTDIDGSRPNFMKYYREVIGPGKPADAEAYR